jgi:hypothetical protein
MDALSLLPFPRSLNMAGGYFTLRPGGRIVLDAAAPDRLLETGRRLQRALHEHANLDWDLAAGSHGVADEMGIVLRVAPVDVEHEEGYEFTIGADGIAVAARTEGGVFYGVCTLIQILQQRGRSLPTLRISDWPDFPVRGLMLDISRDKVPTLQTLFDLVDMLASWKLNHIQLYTEHTFAYRRHPDVWTEASPVTSDDILALDAFCRQRHVELVPNQNSFGHMHRWLVHDRYASLAEVHGEFQAPWGTMKGPFSLCPIDPGSLELVRSLYDELLPNFSSRQVNVGCDETVDLGQGRSKEECEQRGTSRVYLDYLLKIHHEVAARNHTMQFWGDIIVESPELIGDLPKDSVALEWGYEASHPFNEHCPLFAASGIPFYVCPGTSSWNSLGGRTDNAIANLLNAAENGLKYGAAGYLNTDWGDNGHWQVLPVSFLGYAVGAAFSWALDANREMDVASVLSLHAFSDPTGNMGRVAYDLGNVYKAAGVLVPNSSVLFWVLERSLQELKSHQGERPDFQAALEAIDEAMQPLGEARMQQTDAALIVEEYQNTARLMRHACLRGQLALNGSATDSAPDLEALDDDLRDIIREYERLWLARNRPGGLSDSAGRLRKARADYKVST